MIGLRFSNVMYPQDYARFADFQDDATLRKWNLWGYIDARDGAQAVRLALESTITGCEIFVIANADTVMERPNAELLAECFPDVEVRGEVGPHDTLLSIAKARRLLGYEPQHSWRDERVTRPAADQPRAAIPSSRRVADSSRCTSGRADVLSRERRRRS